MIVQRRVSLLVLFALLAWPLAAPAQPLLRPATAGGISVTGSGYVRRPADAVRYTIVLALRSNQATSASVFGSADQLVAALKRFGSADAAIADPLNAAINQQSVVTVRGTIRKPTIESVRTLIANVEATLPSDGVPITQITYVASLDDCSQPERLAQAAAFDEARARASGVAAAAHLTLGPAATVTQPVLPQSGCPTHPDQIVQQNGFALGQSPDALTVTVGVTLNVTFAVGAAP